MKLNYYCVFGPCLATFIFFAYRLTYNVKLIITIRKVTKLRKVLNESKVLFEI